VVTAGLPGVRGVHLARGPGRGALRQRSAGHRPSRSGTALLPSREYAGPQLSRLHRVTDGTGGQR